MPTPLEMFQLANAADPYQSFVEGSQQAVKADIADKQLKMRQLAVDEALKETQADMAASAGATPATPSAAGGKGGLATMSKSVLPPGFEIINDQGLPTLAGQLNNDARETQNLKKKLKMLELQTQSLDPSSPDYTKNMEAIGRYEVKIANATNNARKLTQDAYDEGIYSLSFAKDQKSYDNAINSWKQKTGLPLPPNFPKEYSPDNRDMLINAASAPMMEKIRTRDDKIKQDERADKHSKIEQQKWDILLRDKLAGEAPTGPIESPQQMDSFINQINRSTTKTKQVDRGFAKSTLQQIDPAYRADLSTPDAIRDTGNRLGVAKRAYEISDFINENGVKTGKIGEVKKWADSMSTKSPDKEINLNDLTGAVGNQVLAKKILDFANAYARAESGRNIATVAELKAAMSTFGEKGMSGKSAATVFKYIGDEKVRILADDRFGGNKDAINIRKLDSGKPEATSETVNVGGKTYSRPAGMTDSQWKDYKKSQGVN